LKWSFCKIPKAEEAPQLQKEDIKIKVHIYVSKHWFWE
jgi:hypothetical protein